LGTIFGTFLGKILGSFRPNQPTAANKLSALFFYSLTSILLAKLFSRHFLLMPISCWIQTLDLRISSKALYHCASNIGETIFSLPFCSSGT
jgi:hypothetical protein